MSVFILLRVCVCVDGAQPAVKCSTAIHRTMLPTLSVEQLHVW